jgi:YggT family protein
MSVLGYIIIAFAKVLGLVINLYTMIVIVAALISWVSPDPYNPIVRILYNLTQPAFNLVRRILPTPLLRLRIDISPIIVLLALTIIDTLAVGMLLGVGRNMVVGY